MVNKTKINGWLVDLLMDLIISGIARLLASHDFKAVLVAHFVLDAEKNQVLCLLLKGYHTSSVLR